MSEWTGLEGRLVLAMEQCDPHETAAVAAGIIADHAAVSSVDIWIADYGRIRLEDAVGTAPSKAIGGSLEGRCFSSGQIVNDGERVHVPVSRRGEVVGVLSVDLTGDDVPDLQVAAHLIAHAIDASVRQSDDLQVRRGAARLGLPATIQYSLLPIPQMAGAWLDVACAMEPAYDIAGDSYDYAVSDEGLHIGLFDAVGHGLRATLIAGLVLGAYRRARLLSHSVEKVAGSMQEVMADELADGEFVTGLLMWVDRRRRRLEVLNAGHLPPFLVRDGDVRMLEGRRNVPLGLGLVDNVITVDVEPGDLVVAYTDGVVQARDDEEMMLGERIIEELAVEYARDDLQVLCAGVLAAVEQHVQRPLADDATMLVVRIGDVP